MSEVKEYKSDIENEEDSYGDSYDDYSNEDIPIKIKEIEPEEGEVVGFIKYKPEKNKKAKKWIDKLPTSKVNAFIKTKGTSKKGKPEKQKSKKKKKSKNDIAIKILIFLLGFAAAYVIFCLILGYKKPGKTEAKAYEKNTFQTLLELVIPSITIIKALKRIVNQKTK